MTLRVALVGGPMYDHLYTLFDGLDVEIVVHADHTTLNREVARALGAGDRLDLISTHSKHAPSQARWLHQLDGVVDTSPLARRAVELCRYDGAQYCVPRSIDARIMWIRTDRMRHVPTSWQELADSRVVFGFPGRESGLFNTFFELVVGAGGEVFTEDGRPCFESPQAEDAIATLCRLAARAPADLPGWHYDQVDRALLDGRIDGAGLPPGGWSAIRDNPLVERFSPHPYPAGSQRWVSYAGCHAWAIPTTCGDKAAAIDLLRTLSSGRVHTLDAEGGTVCARVDSFSAIEPISERDRQRLVITTETIEQAMIGYPAHARFPEVEDAGWQAINDALRGMRGPKSAVREIQRRAELVLGA